MKEERCAGRATCGFGREWERKRLDSFMQPSAYCTLASQDSPVAHRPLEILLVLT
jgi:hypothetical protein